MAANFDHQRYVKDGWALFSANNTQFLLAGIICWVVFFLGSKLLVIPLIAAGPLLGGIFVLTMNAIEGEEVDVKQMGAISDIFLPLLFIGIISQIIIGVGFVFIILPGIFLWGCYLFSYLFFLDKKIDFWPAMEASRKFGFENWMNIFILALLLGVMNFIGFIPFGLGIIVTMPLTACIVTEVYNDLIGFESITKAPPKLESEEEEEEEVADHSGYTSGQIARISIFVEKTNPPKIFIQKVIGKLEPSAFRQNPPPVMSGHGLDDWPDDDKELERLIETTIAKAQGDDVAHDDLHKMVMKKAVDPGTKKKMAAVFFIVN